MHLGNGHSHGSSHHDCVCEDTLDRGIVDQRDVRNTSDSLGDGAAIFLAVLGEDGATGAGTSSSESTVGSVASGLRFELESLALGSQILGLLLAFSHCELGEGLNDEVGAIGAGGDEGGSEGEDGAQAQGHVKGGGDGLGALEDADGGLVAGLDGEDRAGDGKDLGVLDQRRGAEVGRDTDVLEDAGRGKQGLRVSEGGAEVVLALLHGLGAGLGEGAHEQAGVGGLSLADLDNVFERALVDAHGGSVGESLDGLLVEFSLQEL